MDTFKIEVELPRDLLIALNVPQAEMSQKAREWMALELFREGYISSGKAAEILGLTKVKFIALLDQRGVDYLDYTSDELTQDLTAALEMIKKS
jgi:predicted HTH domain antitoxin